MRALALVCLSLVAGCGFSTPASIYVSCELVSARGPDGPDDTDTIPWVRGVKVFTGKLPTEKDVDGTFAGADLRVTEASDMELGGTMKYLDKVTRLPDGTPRYDDQNPKQLHYNFRFKRLSNEMAVAFFEKVTPTSIKMHVIEFNCHRVTP